MNKQQLSKLIARRTCACISVNHCCETLADFYARTRK